MNAGGPRAALEIHGLIAGYEGVPVVHGVDLAVAAGEVVALLGANGAGKTTTLLTVSGLLPRLGGRISVLAEEIAVGRHGTVARPWHLTRRGLGHVPEDRSLFFDLTARENLRLGQPRRRRQRSAGDLDRVLDLLPALRDLLDRRAGLLSGGEQQMLALARALIASPRVLLLDEMSLGLAPIVVERLLPVVRRIADEMHTAVLLVEQHVGMALDVADRAYLLRQGAIAMTGTAAEFRGRRDLLEAGYLGSTT